MRTKNKKEMNKQTEVNVVKEEEEKVRQRMLGE